MLYIILVDSDHILHCVDYGIKEGRQFKGVGHATFVNDKIVAIGSEDSKLIVLDPKNVEEIESEHELDIEDIASVHYSGGKSLFIFSGEWFDLDIFDFEGQINDEI